MELDEIIVEKLRNFDISKFKYEKMNDIIKIYPDIEYIKLIKDLNEIRNVINDIDYISISMNRDNIITDYESGIPSFLIMSGCMIQKIYKLVIEKEGYLIINHNIFLYPTMRYLGNYFTEQFDKDIKQIWTDKFVLYYINFKLELVSEINI